MDLAPAIAAIASASTVLVAGWALRRGQTIHRLEQDNAALRRRIRKLRAPKKERPKGPSRPPRRTPAELGEEVLAQLTFDGEAPRVVLLLQGFEPGKAFAGIRTAVLAAGQLAAELSRPLHVIVVAEASVGADESRQALVEVLGQRPGLVAVAESLTLSTATARTSSGHHSDDVWVATFWTTAVALAAMARGGVVRADRVVYLIQDFEPGFYPWGHQYAQALATYDAGFRSLVNSRPLAGYVQQASATTVDDQAVFAPAVDLATLHEAAAGWQQPPDGVIRLLFYARPSKPRNMYATGVAALRLWVERLPDGLEAHVRFAGEDMAETVDLGPRATVEMSGKLSYEAYYEAIRHTDIGLALMLSPHPGHLALELPLAGIPTVTNGFAGARQPWVPGLRVSGTDPSSIADSLLLATAEARTKVRHSPEQFALDLGSSQEAAVAHVARELLVDSSPLLP